jgi:hypothetical protein
MGLDKQHTRVRETGDMKFVVYEPSGERVNRTDVRIQSGPWKEIEEAPC